jgi:hypothetical protein
MHQLERRTRIDHALGIGRTTRTNEPPMGKSWAQSLAAGEHEAPQFAERRSEIGIKGDPSGSFGLQDRRQSGIGTGRHREQRLGSSAHGERLRLRG